ncbi:aspartate/glutamate racemase family protein [Dyadobacter sp. CY261]|uniref:aspartate/glutamate racemase family protein n=1 Tax=Dyadobacter sp. CY261 TaxID=2907203 RepID=UPI001F17BE8C|nr:aspartate/glutamate racemase family protein [Dyadobacter sp. CY261]MCF0074455.1 aspartate/glutamate racemase family protein [Dyadobacter sp. CY261]
MKKLGLVGGMSWVSTVDYYRFINEEVNEKLGGLHFAECIIYSVNFNQFVSNNTAGRWDDSFKMLLHACQSLEKAGAEAIVLCANTAHAVADRLEAQLTLPLIHIVTATAKAIQAQGLTKVGLLGTRFTMEMDFYKDRLLSHGIVPMVPESQETRDFIQDTLRDELGKGIIREETKRRYIAIIEELITKGATGIILGCTEIPMIISQEDVTVPVFDTTRIHSQAAVAFALSE